MLVAHNNWMNIACVFCSIHETACSRQVKINFLSYFDYQFPNCDRILKILKIFITFVAFLYE
jgi:uncharacterized Fe-S cluster-containing radical SAM superfamily enzyme